MARPARRPPWPLQHGRVQIFLIGHRWADSPRDEGLLYVQLACLYRATNSATVR